MRVRFTPVILSALMLAACGQDSTQDQAAIQQQQAEQQATRAAAQPEFDTAITGELVAGDLTQLPSDIQLKLQLLDVTDPSQVPAVVAEREQAAPPILPHRYTLPYDASQVSEDRRYVVQAALEAGGVPLYSTDAPVAVLTGGATANANLNLVRGGSAATTQIAPTVKMKQDFEALEAAIGGMRRVVGERIEESVTIGWDAFIDNSGVRFARESVDFGEAGSGSFRYGYVDGKPWVIVRERGGETTWLGWNPAGELILNENGDGPIDPEQAQSLFDQAAEVLALAEKGAG